jgi:hypothetical protein
MNIKTSTARNRRVLNRQRSIAKTAVVLGILFFFLQGASQTQYPREPEQTSKTVTAAYIKVTFPGRDAVWEKGKSYSIRWESKGVTGSVKIRLVNKNGQVFDVVNSAGNSGSYDWTIPKDVNDGAYKIQVMKVDGSVKGESRATITIEVAKTVSKKVASQPEQGKISKESGTRTGAATTGGAAAAPSASGARSTGTATSAGTSASATSSRREPATAGTVVKQNLQVVRVPEAELKNAKLFPEDASGVRARKPSKEPSTAKIEVFSPHDYDEWIAGNEYLISWDSKAIMDDVKIFLDNPGYPIVERTANSGSYHFRVPRNWGVDIGHHYVRVTTLDGKVQGWSGGFPVYSQDVRLRCIIEIVGSDYSIKQGQDLVFNVKMINYGTLSPITIQNVLVQITKQPENVVIAQEEWGFSGIYPRVWYKLSEPRRFSIWTGPHMKDPKINMHSGKIGIKVWLDPQNLLGEDLRFRNSPSNPDTRTLTIGSK